MDFVLRKTIEIWAFCDKKTIVLNRNFMEKM